MDGIKYCEAITECCKRAEGSPQKSELIRFIDNNLENINMTEEHDESMLNWTAENWIKNIKDNNPCISDEIIQDFEDAINDSFIEYAENIMSVGYSGVYELCGVYWIWLQSSDSSAEDPYPDIETHGPSTDKNKLLSYYWL